MPWVGHEFSTYTRLQSQRSPSAPMSLDAWLSSLQTRLRSQQSPSVPVSLDAWFEFSTYTRLRSQRSPSAPVSLDAWFQFYATSDSILETPPSLLIPDLRRP